VKLAEWRRRAKNLPPTRFKLNLRPGKPTWAFDGEPIHPRCRCDISGAKADLVITDDTTKSALESELLKKELGKLGVVLGGHIEEAFKALEAVAGAANELTDVFRKVVQAFERVAGKLFSPLPRRAALLRRAPAWPAPALRNEAARPSLRRAAVLPPRHKRASFRGTRRLPR
jgi:hypothetical protein